jgi:hypothetical protein
MYARTAYGAPPAIDALPGEQTLPPPIPGGTSSWVYTPNPAYSYVRRSYAGRISTLTYPGGGVSILPVPDRGVMRVTAWWPDATVLSLIRIHADGSIYPVRGAGALAVTGTTRRNFATNPSFEVGLNGYAADAGTPVLARVVDGTAPRGDAHLTATVAGAGSLGIAVPQAIPAGRDVNLSVDLQFSAKPATVTFQIVWADSAGIALPASTATLTADQINNSIGQWWRQAVTIPTPANGVTPTLKILLTGMPAAGVMSVDGVLIGRTGDSADFFDGSTYGGVWLGTVGLSASLIPPVLTFDDGECPLDASVRYRLINPSAIGGSMTSAAAQLDSAGHTWITHPSNPAEPRDGYVKEVPDLLHDIVQGIFDPIDSPYSTVITAKTRKAPSGQIGLWTFSFRDRDSLLDLLRVKPQILVRTPAEFGFQPQWISIGAISETLDGTQDTQHFRLLSGPFVSVEAPAG